jgi:hypothetical protein
MLPLEIKILLLLLVLKYAAGIASLLGVLLSSVFERDDGVSSFETAFGLVDCNYTVYTISKYDVEMKSNSLDIALPSTSFPNQNFINNR